jgi:hypothetical protein
MHQGGAVDETFDHFGVPDCRSRYVRFWLGTWLRDFSRTGHVVGVGILETIAFQWAKEGSAALSIPVK